MMGLGNRALGRKALVLALALVVGLAVVGPASADVVQQSPAENQYGGESPPATSNPTPEAEPEIFLPPTVESAGQDDSAGILPFTGAALVVPSVVGGLLLAGGLFLVYRTRRREN
jgi:hypothetical protein